MSFAMYVIGFLIALGGLIYGAHMLHVPTRWIVAGAITLLGAGIISAVVATRHKDPVE